MALLFQKYVMEKFVNKFQDYVNERPMLKYFLTGLSGATSLLYLYRKYDRSLPLEAYGKAVFITGCDSGFGKAAVLEFNRLGYAVFAGCLNKAEAVKMYSDLLKSNPDTFHVVQIDVTKQDQIDAAGRYVQKWLEVTPSHRLWGLICNAGIGRMAPLEVTTIATFQQVYNVNVFGVMRCVKAFAPLIRSGGSGGRIAITNSLMGELAVKNLGCYGSSKAALHSIADILRAEMLQFDIRVSSICPDSYATSAMAPEVISAIIDKEVEAADKKVLAAYGGDKLVEKMKNDMTVKLPLIWNTDLTPVTNCMAHAISSKEPLYRYYPISWLSWIGKFVSTFAPDMMSKMD